MAKIATLRRSLRLSYSGDEEFNKYVETQEKVTVKPGLTGSVSNGSIDDADVDALMEGWKQFQADKAEKRKAAKAEREEQERLLALKREEQERLLAEEEAAIAEIARNMPITSSNGFEGHRITYYGGYVSGDEVTVISDYFLGGNFNKDAINNQIKKMRITAIDELKVAAAQIGCNAVIGLDFDYVTIDRTTATIVDKNVNETYVILTANGTAVTIEEL